MTTERDINLAYLQGLHELSPEPEDAARDAEEFGIPYGEPARDEHVLAGREVGYVLTAAKALPLSPAAEAMRTWIAGASRDQLRHDIRGAIAKQVSAGDIRPHEVDGLFGAIGERKESFNRWPQGD